MKLEKPRLEPLAVEDMPEEARVQFGDRPIFNIFRTLARHPKLMKRWMVFGNHVLAKSSLPPRERELVILRIGWLCDAEYEWGQHVLIGRECGLTDEEIEHIADGPESEGWSPRDRALLRATDELKADSFISDSSWAEVSGFYDEQQLMDLVFTVGQYNLVSMALNTLGVQLDDGLPVFPKR
jgi:4-carboxymuconolactone decarboxylase